MYLFDFTRGNWTEEGHRIALDGKGISDGYFDTHVEDDEVIRACFAAYIPDDSDDGIHLVDKAGYDSWLYGNKDTANDYHWYECVSDYLDTLTQDAIKQKLDGKMWMEVEVSFADLGYVDYKNDPDIQSALTDMWAETDSDDFCHDTYTITKAQERAKSSS